MGNKIATYPAHKIEIVRGEEGDVTRGAFSCVKLGRLRGKKVAIKCFYNYQDKSNDLKVFNGVRQEFCLQRLASHDNILQAFEISTWSYGVALITKHSPYGNLWHLLSERKPTKKLEIESGADGQSCVRIYNKYPINFQLRLRMAHDVTRGLAHLHALQRGRYMLHGDLKCDSVMVMWDLTCKIGDFGSAFLFDSEERLLGGSPRITCTLSHCAPEKLLQLSRIQEEEGKVFNPSPCRKTDVFSLGMVFYTILLRWPPHHSMNQQEMMKAVLGGLRPDTTSLDLLLEEDYSDRDAIHVLNSEMRRCWSQDPGDRPRAFEVLRSLEEVLQHQEVVLIEENIRNIQEIRKDDVEDPATVPLDRFRPDTMDFVPEETQLRKRFQLGLGRQANNIKYLCDGNNWLKEEVRLHFQALPFTIILLLLVWYITTTSFN